MFRPHTPTPLRPPAILPPLGSRQPAVGTDVSICPPRGFVWRDHLRAWESEQGEARLKVLQFRGQDYYQRRHRLEQLLIPADTQVDWWERREDKHQQMDALYLGFQRRIPTLLAEMPDVTCHQVLAFGNEQVLILVTAHYPHSYPDPARQGLLTAIQSARYHPGGLEAGWAGETPFFLDVSLCDLQQIDILQQPDRETYVFRSAATSPQPGLQVMVDIHAGQPNSLGQTLEQLFQKNFFSSYEVLEVQELVLPTHHGLEAFAIEHRKAPASSRIEYVAILQEADQYLTFTCLAPDDQISHLATFRKLIRSYQRN